MRRARTYSSTCSQANFVYLHPFYRNLRVHSFAAENRKKLTENPYFGGPGLFKFIDVDTIQKHIISACYDKQHVCAYLQPFSR